MITIRRFLQIIYWTSIIILCFWILLAILKTFIPIEFANDNIELNYFCVRFYVVPIAILFTLTGTIKRNDTIISIIIKSILTIGVSIFSVFIMAIILLGSTCSWITEKIYFENKKNTSTKIVLRSFGCGATDSSYPTYEVFKVSELTPNLIWATKIDTTQIDENEWIRIENE